MHEEYKDNGVNYVRIDKKKARIKYNEGKTIYLVRDGMRLDNAWPFAYPICKTEQLDFDNRVNQYQRVNYLRGVKYLIKEEDCV